MKILEKGDFEVKTLENGDAAAKTSDAALAFVKKKNPSWSRPRDDFEDGELDEIDEIFTINKKPIAKRKKGN